MADAGFTFAQRDCRLLVSRRCLLYKLGGKSVLPEAQVYTPSPLNPPTQFGDAAVLARGQDKYNSHCTSCHGNDGRLTTLFPDLRYAGVLHGADAFKAIVIDGAMQVNGMVSFAKVMTPQDAEAIRAYVTSLAHEAKNAPPAPGRGLGGAPGNGPDVGAGGPAP